MTLQQLRALCELAERGLNFSRTAAALNTTQPAISRMIRSLEHELGADLLVRRGKTMLRLTTEGEEALLRARQVLLEITNIAQIGVEKKDAERGELTIATTHTQASYGLVAAISDFRAAHPGVTLHMRDGAPAEIAQWVSMGQVDLGINARPQRVPANIVALDAYRIERCIIAPLGHPILRLRKPAVRDIARYPIIDYEQGARTGEMLRNLFVNAGVESDVAVTATDATAVMAYVEAGVGIAILQKQILDQLRHRRIGAVDATHLVPASTTMLLLRKKAYLRNFVYRFIEIVAPQWPREEVERRLNRVDDAGI
jgi:DNA-binding transcriptional LysR family regulator